MSDFGFPVQAEPAPMMPFETLTGTSQRSDTTVRPVTRQARKCATPAPPNDALSTVSSMQQLSPTVPKAVKGRELPLLVCRRTTKGL